MISYILGSFRTFFIFILTVYFFSNFMGYIYIFCNGIYFAMEYILLAKYQK